jgi:hypothetical protein
MSILDDAIREHLELKRAHGADDAELKKLEDEAFGPPQGDEEHDPFAEAPTEFLVAPAEEMPAGEGAGDPEEEGGRRSPNITDLQEAPAPAPEEESIVEAGPSTEERHAIADQPTEMFDVEGQFEDAATEADAPSDEQLVDAELSEPRLAPVDPIAGIEASAAAGAPSPAADEDEPADEFDEFFSDQRLSDELNQALEAPLPDEPAAPALEEAEPPASAAPATEEATAIYEVDAAEPDSVVEELPLEEPAVEYEAVEDSHEEPPAPEAHTEPGHEDVLEDTPEFLQDDPEDDNLWFEQKPPKDIDFGD